MAGTLVMCDLNAARIEHVSTSVTRVERRVGRETRRRVLAEEHATEEEARPEEDHEDRALCHHVQPSVIKSHRVQSHVIKSH